MLTYVQPYVSIIVGALSILQNALFVFTNPLNDVDPVINGQLIVFSVLGAWLTIRSQMRLTVEKTSQMVPSSFPDDCV